MKRFNTSRLKLKPLRERESKTTIGVMINPDSKPPEISEDEYSRLESIANSIKSSRERNYSVVWAFGAHLIKNGLSKVLIELMKRGYVQHILANEAVVIHDWELAYHGQTEEDVREQVKEGQFGLWEETGEYLNLAVNVGAKKGWGYGESIGRLIQEESIDGKLISHPNKNISVLARARKLEIPFSVGANIGQSINYTHPDCDGAAIGATSYRDFLRLVETFSNLQGGVYLSIGSAILSPQIFEKSISMARNIALQDGRPLDDFDIVVNDVQDGGWDWSQGEPPKDNPAYYLRFMKTFARMPGRSQYIQMDNRKFLHNLYHLLN